MLKQECHFKMLKKISESKINKIYDSNEKMTNDQKQSFTPGSMLYREALKASKMLLALKVKAGAGNG